MNAPTPPNRHLMALITYLALVPLVYLIPDWVAGAFAAHKLVHVMVSVGLIVPIISYLLIPLSLRCLARVESGQGR